jgi:hypothetical protein
MRRREGGKVVERRGFRVEVSESVRRRAGGRRGEARRREDKEGGSSSR